MSQVESRFRTFSEFYPYYLREHTHPTCRLLHFVGSTLVLIVLFTSLLTQKWALLWLLPLIGYGFAWVGHFFYEKNKPATFRYPLYSLLGDWVMFKDILIGRVTLKHKTSASQQDDS
ncbi:DUF962 domain-containing protein [Alteromonas ponticola]|uniref:DUF962 domain-containing protein n=1 Tax=Alteromonas ponticola TaxID=2720613 RepID=A0ABX1R0X9_9ALTE|nr:DUF962 domain-containing protein [Alteromonas ponticola]NMH60125.1 DUF962 domain-containing protein [Alteromonas ponticola]